MLLSRSICLTLLALAILPLTCSKEQKAIKEMPTSEPTSSATDSTLAGRYFSKAEQFGKAQEYDSAMAYLKTASRLYKAQWESYVRCYNEMGRCSLNMGGYDEVLAYGDTALEVGRTRLGGQHPILANTYNLAGQAYWVKGDYEQSLASLNQAISIQLANHREKDLLSALIYNNLATVYWGKSDYDEAIALYDKALQIQLAISGENYNVALYYNNMGLAFSEKKDYEKSIALHKKALSILPSLVGEQDPYVAETYINLGHAYWSKGDNDEALRLYKKALSIQQATIGDAHPDLTLTYSNMGDAYRGKKDYDGALLYYRKTLALELATYGGRHPDVAEIYMNLADAYADKGDAEEALKFYQQAILANVPTFADHDPYANPRLESIFSENLLLETLARKAAAIVDLYVNQSHKLHDLEAAASTYQLAGQLIDQMRSGYKAEGSKFFLAEKATDIYGHAIQSMLQIHAATRRDEHKDAAFLFAEKSKAGIMRDALSEAEAKQFAGIPDSLLQKERRLRIDLAFYDGKLTEEQLQSEASDSVSLAYLKDKVFSLKQAYDTLLQRFEQEYPAYYNLKYQIKTAAVPEVQQLLDDRTALVEYFTGEDSIFIFALTKNNFTIKVSAKDSLFEQQIKHLRQGIIKQDFDTYTQAAHRLYQTLFAPVAAHLNNKNLIIVPDGAVSAIPFEVLLTEQVVNSKWQDYLTLPYLVNSYGVSYTYSGTLLQQEQARKKRKTKRDYLAFAPVFANGLPMSTRGGDFFKENLRTASFNSATASVTRLRGYLPMTKKEVAGILERFEISYGFFERWFGNKSRVYVEREAKEEKLKSEDIEDYRILHFATHGLVNEKNPKLSGLILSPEDSTSKEDGILHLSEIYNLNLNADLVVLSACETGLGQVAKGEGIIGLTRGFLYAGASNLLVSLWQVSDATTADLMVDFYDKMLGGMSKPEALREAKLQLIRRHPEYAKPYYWAPFILVGR